MVTPLAFVDTETTGLDPDRHEIWEVGLILRDSEGVDVEYLWQLPVDAGRADAIALKIGRFYERRTPWLVAETGVFAHRTDRPGDDTMDTGKTMGCWARQFAELTAGAHLVGAVPSFDDAFLKPLLRRNGACPDWHYHLIDVEALAAGFLTGTFSAIQEVGKNPDADGPTQEEAMQALPPWDSNALSLAVGVDPDDFDRHTALGDAQWARAIYDRVIGRPPEESYSELCARVGYPRDGEPEEPF